MTDNRSQMLILLLLFIPIFSVTLFAQRSGALKGTVRDSQTKEVLPFTNVFIVGTSIGAATDMDGEYSIRNIPPGKYTLSATYVGYQQMEIPVEIFEGKTTVCDIMLRPDVIEGETILITAQAEGQMAAINEQLSSIPIKNVVSLARIQELPDANAAESVGRLPGVSLIRTGGEGAKVVVRGLSPQYNRVTIDGVELPANSASSDIADHKSEYRSGDELSLTGDRATDLSMISSNMLGGIEVIKAITPDMDATIIGGVINFTMRKAVKTDVVLPKFEVLSQGSYNGLKETGRDYKFVGSYEQRFFDDKFGIFAQASIENRNLSANELGADYNFTGRLLATDEGDPEFQTMGLKDVLRERDRYGATFVFDYTYETGNIGFMNFFSRSETNNITREESYYLLDDDAYYRASNSDAKLDAFSNLLSIKQTVGNVGIDLKLSHSYSGNNIPDEVRFNFWQNGVGFIGKYSFLKYKSPKEVSSHVVHNLENAVFFDISNVLSTTKDRTLNGTIDLYTDFVITKDITSKIKVGGAYNYRDRSYVYEQSNGSVFYDDGGQVLASILRVFPQFGTSITFSDLIDKEYSYGNFLKGDYKLSSPLDVNLMLRVMDVAKKNPGVGTGGGYKRNKFSSIYYDYSGNETRSAVYGMTTINLGQMFTIVPGLRYQNLTTEYSGIRALQIPGDIQYSNVTEKVSHGYFLPMVHFRFKPLTWFQFHFAYTNTLNYPDYNTIIPRYYIGTNFVLYNNHKLKPATSENFDVFLSFYSNQIGLFSVGGFKKKIEGLILPSKSYPKDFSAYPELFDIMKNKTETYSLLTYINSPIDIDVLGLETEWQTNFWYLPEPFNGLVLNVNYTHIFSEANYPKSHLVTYLDENWVQQTYSVDTFYTSRLLYQPNDIINIALGYDYRGFSMRVSMLYQDNIFKRPDFWYQNRIHSDKYIRFDFSAKQMLPWYGIQVYFNLNNIGSEDDVDINQKTGHTTLQQSYGMSADLGLRIKL
ncbi:MAG: TonB-dependent receptor [Bacteroidota bacterium]